MICEQRYEEAPRRRHLQERHRQGQNEPARAGDLVQREPGHARPHSIVFELRPRDPLRCLLTFFGVEREDLPTEIW